MVLEDHVRRMVILITIMINAVNDGNYIDTDTANDEDNNRIYIKDTNTNTFANNNH